MKQKKIGKVENAENKKSFIDWKKRRDVILRSIPVDVDLENRKIFFDNKLKEVMNLEFNTSNVDNLITNYVDPKDAENVIQSLLEAKQGMEKPIHFKFIHPQTALKLNLEFRYEIVYVTYASTRLHGLLVNLPGTKGSIANKRKRSK
ncbi:MAG: hypothetical protein PSX36_12275 [bacterium]|nr:hypothetical protein [bacterium]